MSQNSNGLIECDSSNVTSDTYKLLLSDDLLKENISKMNNFLKKNKLNILTDINIILKTGGHYMNNSNKRYRQMEQYMTYALLVASLVISISNVMRANQLRAQAEEMQAEYDKLKEENRKLQYFLNKEVDEDYIIEYARDVLGMYFPDEDVYYNDVNE